MEKSPEQLRHDIGATRSEMEGTVGEIKERLSSEHIRGQMRETLRDKTRRVARAAGEAKDRMMERTRRAYSSTSGLVEDWTRTGRELGNEAVETVKKDPRTYISIGAAAGLATAGLIWALRRKSGNGREDEEMYAAYPERSSSMGLGQQPLEPSTTMEDVGVSAGREMGMESEGSRFGRYMKENPLLVSLGLLTLGSILGAFLPEVWKIRK